MLKKRAERTDFTENGAASGESNTPFMLTHGVSQDMLPPAEHIGTDLISCFCQVGDN